MFTACQQRLSGNLPAVLGRRPSIVLEMMSRSQAITLGTVKTLEKHLVR